MSQAPTLTIVIPTLNEAAGIAETLRLARGAAPDAEILVADGGSSDGTAVLAAAADSGARVIAAPRGRARQMNAAAAEARGEWLLFLHADTRLPEGFTAEIARVAEAGGEAGAFPLRIAGRHPLLPVLAWGATLRTRWRGIALGDQALFIRRARFAGLGGFPAVALMEDYAFCLLLKREGLRLHLARRPVVTSGRRWDELGFFRVWWKMRWLYLRYRVSGAPPPSETGYPDVR